ncbi:MAG: coenzyme F420-0:L-glutamate ligase [Nocardioidaceae bacterium]
MTTPVTVLPVPGIGEVTAGTDLAALIHDHVVEGDIVVITSKIVSKAEGRLLGSTEQPADKAEAVSAETVRVVARRARTRIVRNRLGLTMAGAGVDASNTPRGTVLLLPLDPDATARTVREALPVNAAVIVSDTSGRAWREGQTDIAIGAAGLRVAHDFAGSQDGYGNTLEVTLTAIADEIAAAADLVKGKLTGCPVALVRGLAGLVLPPGEHGPGAAALIRPDAGDLFGLGFREAAMGALSRDDPRGFGEPATAEVLLEALHSLGIAAKMGPGEIVVTGDERACERAAMAAYAHSWRAERPEGVQRADNGEVLRLLPGLT